MIKICGDLIIVPLKIIFEQSSKERKFPELWKNANIVSVQRQKPNKNLSPCECDKKSAEFINTFFRYSRF